MKFQNQQIHCINNKLEQKQKDKLVECTSIKRD